MSAVAVILGLLALILLAFLALAAFSISVSLMAVQKALEAQNRHYGVGIVEAAAAGDGGRGELRPGFAIRADLDGDDSAPVLTGVVEATLERTLASMKSDGTILGYTLDVVP